jgi:hypothetical protein
MRKIMAVLLLAALVTGSVFAEDGLAISGEVKTGLNISKAGDDDVKAKIHNSDANKTPGRIRFNFVYTKGIIQFKWRFQLAGNGADKLEASSLSDLVPYAYALADFFDNQFRMSLGSIDGDSPWETSGDEVWANVDNVQGARFEFKPAFLSGLNVGMALGARGSAYEIGDYFQELVFGARYENDTIDARLGFALDGPDGKDPDTNPDGSKLVWRLNAKFVGSAVPGLSVWLNGQVNGIGGTSKKITKTTTETKHTISTAGGTTITYTDTDTTTVVTDNTDFSRLSTDEWLYIKYDPKPWDAALRLGLHTYGIADYTTKSGTTTTTVTTESVKRTMLNVKPVFNYKFNDWLSAGLTVNAELVLGYKDGTKVGGEDPALFDSITVDPKLTFTLGGGASIATAYTLKQTMANSISAGDDKGKTTNTFEIRFVYSF